MEFDTFEFLDGLDALPFSEWDSNAFIRERTDDPKIKSESSSAMVRRCDDEGEEWVTHVVVSAGDRTRATHAELVVLT